ncbi:MAG TPA: T9SS type A sorting domain-containing protein, partial [Saprospiraceae bacterium]|nr:T9SS type A sorting domain-containing protein [Saprospiraceae bacterium]
IGKYDVRAGAWGYGYATRNGQNLTAAQDFTLKLDKGYRDDFALDYGWEVSGTSPTGVWERAEPQGIDVGVVLCPEHDFSGDVGDQCYVTGNGNPGVDVDDVESGTAILRSPVMDLTTYSHPVVRGLYYFTSITFDNQSLDSIKFYIENGTDEALLASSPGFNFNWQILNKPIEPLIPITSTMRLRIECFDNPDYLGADSYEAVFDDFKIAAGAASATLEPFEGVQLVVRPNPFRGQAILDYTTPAGGEYQVVVTDLLGRQVQQYTVDGTGGYLSVGAELRPGVYLARLQHDGQMSEPVKLVKAE